MSQAPASPLKWIAAVTAVITLVLGLNQVLRVFAELGERQRQLTELQAMAARQREVGDFPAAWASLERALTSADQGSFLAKLSGRLDAPRLELRKAQEDLAMAWLREVRVPEGKSFADVVDPLLAVITRGSIDADGAREADLLAHLGWAYFLKSRDGAAAVDPAQSYHQALAVDARNPFAHAFWGHWLVWRRQPYAEAASHFEAALQSGREREFVRQLQLASLRNHASMEMDQALLRTLDEMRRQGEPIDQGTRRHAQGVYSAALNSEEALTGLLGALAPTEHIATVRELFGDDTSDPSQSPLREAVIALLQERAGQREQALASWEAVRSLLGPGGEGRLADLAADARKRLAAGARR